MPLFSQEVEVTIALSGRMNTERNKIAVEPKIKPLWGIFIQHQLGMLFFFYGIINH